MIADARLAIGEQKETHVRFQQFGDRYIVRLESGERLMERLIGFLASEDIEFASLTGCGAVRAVTLGYWNAETRAYEFRDLEEQLEVVSFEGNSALKDDQPFLHIHGVFSRQDFSTRGGHIKDLVVHPTLEVSLRTEDVEIRRTKDQASGLDLLDLPERA